ncbi:MAG: type III pantothenate kinase [Vulcanococcus sp.]
MARLLLVGNSRWHWARRQADGLHVWHEPGPPQGACGDPGEPWADLEAWAAVGALPQDRPPPPERRLGLERVPLADLPPWLGIDRALAGWQAWRRQGAGVLVADAGTCLSLTWIDAAGRFRGGRLSAGLALQLRSLGAATAQLPTLTAGAELGDCADPWPRATASALEVGCLTACAAAVLQGWRDLQASGEASQLWLSGGDGERLAAVLGQAGLTPALAPDLALEGLAALAQLS